MKKKLILILGIILLIGLIFLLINKKDINNFCNDIRFEKEHLIAVSHLDNKTDSLSKFDCDFKTIKVYEISQGDSYLVIPNEDVEIKIYKYIKNEDNYEKGNLIIATSKPFVITYDEENKIILELTKEDLTKEYIPAIEEGNLNKKEYVLDITK